MSFKLVFAASAVAAVLAANLSAGIFGYNPDDLALSDTVLVAFDWMPVAPTLITEFPLSLFPTDDTPRIQYASSAEWDSRPAGFSLIEFPARIKTVRWAFKVIPDEGPAGSNISLSQAALFGTTAVLTVALIALAVGFLTLGRI